MSSYYEELDQILEKYKFNSILDVGCGSADVLVNLKKHRSGLKAIGFDNDEPKMQGYKDIMLEKGIKIFPGDATQRFPFKNKTFDAVISAAVLMLIDTRVSTKEAIKTLKEMERVAKKYIILVEPSKVWDRIKGPMVGKKYDLTEIKYWPGSTHNDIGNIIIIKL